MQLGIFTSADGPSFDKAKNLHLVEWNKTSRITNLSKP